MNLYPLVRPLLMRLDAEDAHRLTLAALRCGLGPRGGFAHPALETRLWGRTFKNPLGLAAGFDKEAEALGGVLRMGFGFAEAGTVTPRAQKGNPRPRVFRDVANESVINRMGFPGGGLAAFEKRLRAFKAKNPDSIVGANIGINKDTADAPAAYAEGFRALAPVADYIAVNVSSPNTAGLRDLQAREALDGLLSALRAQGSGPPLLLKIAPDLEPQQRADIAELALAHRIDGLIVSNTTVARPPALAEALKNEKGGLSGRLLMPLSTQAVRDFHVLTGGRIPLIGAGGIASADDAYEKIRAGASLVQLYTALAYQGPALVGRILEGLAALLQRDGFATVAAAVGSGHAPVRAVV